MPINLEVKIKVPSHNKIIKLLRKHSAKYNGILNQTDIYYKTKAVLLKLRIVNNRYELIKYNRNEKGKNRWSNFEVLHLKEKKVEKYFENIFEIETKVEKKRLLYVLDNTRVHLDDVKNLGKFVELETMVVLNKAEAKKEFVHIINILELEFMKQIRSSYRNLSIEYDSLKSK